MSPPRIIFYITVGTAIKDNHDWSGRVFRPWEMLELLNTTAKKAQIVYLKVKFSSVGWIGIREMLHFLHPFWGRGEDTHHWSGLLALSYCSRTRTSGHLPLVLKERVSRDAPSVWLWMDQIQTGAVKEAPRANPPPAVSSHLIHPFIRGRVWLGRTVTNGLESKEEAEGLAEAEEDLSERHKLATSPSTWQELWR